MKRFLPLCLILTVLSLLFPHIGLARDDWELWTELRWKKPISEQWGMFGAFVGRFRRNMGEFYRQYDDIGFSYKALAWLKVEPGYQWNFAEKARTHDTIQEHRLYVNLIPQGKIGVIQLENRNRLEFRHVNGVDDWRYRNRSKASLPLGKDRWWHIKPFLSDEIFYGFRAGELNRNRFSFGLERPVSKLLSVELYYLVESNKAGKDWDEFQVLGVASTLNF